MDNQVHVVNIVGHEFPYVTFGGTPIDGPTADKINAVIEYAIKLVKLSPDAVTMSYIYGKLDKAVKEL